MSQVSENFIATSSHSGKKGRHEHLLNASPVSRILEKKTSVVEAYVTPPSFMLYLWACFPLLLLATSNLKAGIVAVVATIINFVLIHLDTFFTMRYFFAGIVTFTVIALYGEGII